MRRMLSIKVGLLVCASMLCGHIYARPVSVPSGKTSSGYAIRTISRDTICREHRRITADGVLRFTGGARIIKGTGCSISFEGIGLADPLSKTAVFSGFNPGDIIWSGSAYPRVVATSLWSGSDVSDKIKSAIAALAGKQNVTIKVYPGNLGSGWQLKAGQNLYLTKGVYTNSINLPDAIEFYLESNTSVYGDGSDATIIQESSSPGRNARLFG